MKSPLLLALLLCAAPFGAAAAEESIALRKIREAGVISIGHRDTSMPFSYLDERQRPIGYSMSICDRIVEAVRLRLGLHQLERRFVPVTSATRIPLVANGTIDLECGVTTNNLERQKQVAFSVTTFVAASRLLSKKATPIVRVDDLRGKAVVSTVGTTSLRHVQDLNTQRGLDVTVLAGKDDAESFSMVEKDRAAAYAMDDVLLRGSIATSRRPEDFVISDEALSVEPYGVMLRKGDETFKRLVDETIVALFKSGEIHRIYGQWFESPIPPKGIVLGLPMHPALRRAIERPTDSGDPAVYR